MRGQFFHPLRQYLWLTTFDWSLAARIFAPLYTTLVREAISIGELGGTSDD